MACHELAALRVGLMNVLGLDDPAERAHELAEIGAAVHEPGPIGAMTRTKTLGELKAGYESALSDLEQRVAAMPASDPQLPYYRTLIVTTKKVELELQNQLESMRRFYDNLEEMHDFIHEIYPAD